MFADAHIACVQTPSPPPPPSVKIDFYLGEGVFSQAISIHELK